MLRPTIKTETETVKNDNDNHDERWVRKLQQPNKLIYTMRRLNKAAAFARPDLS